VAGEHAAVTDLNKIWGRKIGILGLRAPETAILRIVGESRPRETSTDRAGAQCIDRGPAKTR